MQRHIARARVAHVALLIALTGGRARADEPRPVTPGTDEPSPATPTGDQPAPPANAPSALAPFLGKPNLDAQVQAQEEPEESDFDAPPGRLILPSWSSFDLHWFTLKVGMFTIEDF